MIYDIGIYGIYDVTIYGAALIAAFLRIYHNVLNFSTNNSYPFKQVNFNPIFDCL